MPVIRPHAFLPRTIRHRLAVILALPTTALVLLAVLGTVAQGGRATAAATTRQQVAVIVDTEAFVAELQRERGLTAGLLAGDRSFRATLNGQRGATDRAQLTLERELADSGGIAAGQAVRHVLHGLTSLSLLRGRVDAGSVSKPTAFNWYTDAVSALNTAAFSHPGSDGDGQLSADLVTLRTLSDAAEAAALERGTLNGVLAAGHFAGTDYQDFVNRLSQKNTALSQVSRTASGAQQADLDRMLRSPAATKVDKIEQQVLPHAGAGHLAPLAAAWWSAASALVDGLHQVQTTTAADSTARAGALVGTAQAQLALNAALAVLAIAVAVGLWLAAGRSITRPLLRLSEEADALAGQLLPAAVAAIREAEPGSADAVGASVPPSTLAGRRDEIAQVATALDRVSATAIHLAVDQAVLQRNTTESLANLGFRNRELVTRQLDFLSALEESESDPGKLADLFELDHLSTRMRRNAENLLVLVGERSPRRWAHPIGMGDVLRSALGEVEDYRRVVLRQVEDLRLDGGVVAEVAHLVAELLENSLAASPRDAEVEVYARGQGQNYLVAVVDRGQGMSAADLAAANRRLAGEETFLLGRTRLLGHYVVGRLAAGLGARVWLSPSPMAGVTASVLIPGVLFTAPRPDTPAAPVHGGASGDGVLSDTHSGGSR